MSYPTSPPHDPYGEHPFEPVFQPGGPADSPLSHYHVGRPPSAPPYQQAAMAPAGLPQVPYQQPYQQQQPYPQQLIIQLPPTSGLAVASMVFGIIGLMGGWCVFGLPCLIAVLLGHAGMADTKGGRKQGRGMAVAGLVMGYIIVVPAILFSALFVFAGALGSSQQ
jgi:hypothetical protein